MSPALDAFLRSWPAAPGLLAALGVTALVYLRGWRALHRRDPCRWTPAHPAAFLAGLAAVYLALASPLESFAALLLQAHMAQHLLLMMAAPPLVWLGEPLFPLLRGLPAPVRSVWVAPLFRSRRVRGLFTRLTHPVTALTLFVAATWLWHAPALYGLALRSDAWHYAQHASFLGTALLFWFAVVRPYPSRPRWSPWLLLPCLVVADVQNTVLSALLTFSDRVLYAHYAEVPRLTGATALDDQAAAGLLMWVPGSVGYLGPLFVIGVGLLAGAGRRTSPPAKSRPMRVALPVVGGWHARSGANGVEGGLSRPSLRSGRATHGGPAPGFDVLRLPGVGRFLRWRHARLAVQFPLLLLALAVIYDGLCGPQMAPLNLAGVLPWVHWRGVVILGLLAAGNVFCLGCPFLLPRTLARRWLPAGRAWPRWLRNKWPAVALVALFLWAYEALALWDRPAWTAGLALGYFAAPLLLDGLFRGAPFCKYVCPIGQFNFVQSLVSPLEVSVRDAAVCQTCRTKDCLRGRGDVAGCELHLFVPRKAGNLDCTFCLDCARACPHDNVGVAPVTPTAELWHDSHRSGVGRFGRRADLAALALLLTFGAFANAAGMVGPVVDWQTRLGERIGVDSPLVLTTVFSLLALGVVPALAVAGATVLSRRWGRLEAGGLEVAARHSLALVPLGFGMWLAHYSFHFLTGYDAAIPAAQRFAADLGWAAGPGEWACACCRAVGDALLRFEIVALDVGLLLSLHAGWRVALAQARQPARAAAALAPWAALAVLLFAAGVWVLLQPMQMRGTLMMAG